MENRFDDMFKLGDDDADMQIDSTLAMPIDFGLGTE